MAQTDPQAKVYKVAKYGTEWKLHFMRDYSTVRRAISILDTQASIAKNNGIDVRKVGKYHFFKATSGTVVMLYYCNVNSGLQPSVMRKAYEAGVAAFA